MEIKKWIMVIAFVVTLGLGGMAYADCAGCCSTHGGVVCIDGVTICGDGTPLSATCAAKECNLCETDLSAPPLILTDSSPVTATSGSVGYIYGSTGANNVIIESGATVTLFNFPGNNTITIEADSSFFQVSRSGATVFFQGGDGTSLKMPATTTSQSIEFNDKIAMLMIDSGQVMLGEEVVKTEVIISKDDPGIIFWLDFNDHEKGVYTKENLSQDWNWNDVDDWQEGVTAERVHIEDEDGNKVLQVSYPDGTYGTDEGGAQWKQHIKAHDDLYFAYKVKFGPNFNFVRGGKLPGLAGGQANTGGDVPEKDDGWSGRIVWGKNGTLAQYVYYLDQHQNLPWGDKFWWSFNGSSKVQLIPDIWYQVETRIVMNTPGGKDGLIESWLNGVQVLKETGLRFRDSDSLAIDIHYFSTFFGGGDDTWATTQNETIYFDDFIISTNPITH